MIGVVVPAHNEEACIGACLESVQLAARHPALKNERVMVVVALDACSDCTGSIARQLGARTVSLCSHNVGSARALGASAVLDAGARWLACTDADSTVATDWLVSQLALGSDAVCGTVSVGDWGAYGERMRAHYDASYTDADGHHHIHGANLGVSAQAYLRAGGFQAIESSEDVALVDALIETGASICWSAAPRVVTSARRCFRAPAGFGATLLRIETQADAAATSEQA